MNQKFKKDFNNLDKSTFLLIMSFIIRVQL